MMRGARALLAVALLFACVSAYCQDLVSVWPKAKVVYEDARVRVVWLRVAPGETVPLHDRPARVVIPLTASTVRMRRADGTMSSVRSEAGTAAWSGPGRRTFTNGEQPLSNIIVEIKNAAAPAQALAGLPSPLPGNYLDEPFHHWLFENQYARVYDVRIPPGATTQFHLHALDSAAVMISGGRVAAQTQGQRWPRAEDVKAGEVRFAADSQRPFTHRVRNEGAVEYHVILVQLLQ